MIAIITPVFNGVSTIEKTINSLLKQTNTDWVSIIVNDGSTDGTSEILKKYESDHRFVIIHLTKNHGRGFARNIALKKANELNAQYMCMLDADDSYHPIKLQIQSDFMRKNQSIVLCSASIGVVNKKGLYRIYEIASKTIFFLFDNYESINIVPHASSIIRLELVDVEFNEELKYAEDQDFMRRLLINKKYAFLPSVLYYYHRDLSFSVDKYKYSLQSNLKSFKSLNVSISYLNKLKLKNGIKLYLFILLNYIHLDSLYYNRIGRKPTTKELNEYSDYDLYL